jgi:hypothetical protein
MLNSPAAMVAEYCVPAAYFRTVRRSIPRSFGILFCS